MATSWMRVNKPNVPPTPPLHWPSFFTARFFLTTISFSVDISFSLFRVRIFGPLAHSECSVYVFGSWCWWWWRWRWCERACACRFACALVHAAHLHMAREECETRATRTSAHKTTGAFVYALGQRPYICSQAPQRLTTNMFCRSLHAYAAYNRGACYVMYDRALRARAQKRSAKTYTYMPRTYTTAEIAATL